MGVPWRAWLGPARLPFLLLTPACIVLAVAWSAVALSAQGLSLAWADAGWCLLGALAAHVLGLGVRLRRTADLRRAV